MQLGGISLTKFSSGFQTWVTSTSAISIYVLTKRKKIFLFCMALPTRLSSSYAYNGYMRMLVMEVHCIASALYDVESKLETRIDTLEGKVDNINKRIFFKFFLNTRYVHSALCAGTWYAPH